MAETTNQSSDTSSASVSTGELGSYRALSTMAVLSFVLSLLSLLSFAHWLFLWTVPLAAMVTGALALRRIASAPQDWTGARLAQTGIGLAAICFLGSVGRNIYWHNWVRTSGKAIAARFVAKLQGGDLESAFWLTVPSAGRKEAQKMQLKDAPRELMQQYQMFREEMKPLGQGLADGSSRIEFDGVEQTGEEYGQDIAAIIYKVHSPTGDSHLLLLASTSRSPSSLDAGWHIRQHNSQYQPNSFRVRAPAGHGHSH